MHGLNSGVVEASSGRHDGVDGKPIVKEVEGLGSLGDFVGELNNRGGSLVLY